MLEQTAAFIRSRIVPRLPQTLIILGSGLGSLGEKLENAVSLDYKDIPDFPQSTRNQIMRRYLPVNRSRQR